MKLNGYPASPFDPYWRWNPLAVFLRSYGAWLLVLPPLWVALATVSAARDRGVFSIRVATITGVAVAAVTILLFLYATVFPGWWKAA